MFQPELLNNILCQASQQEAPCTTKRTLANPIIPNFYKGRCCIGPGKARQAFLQYQGLIVLGTCENHMS